MNQPIFEPQTFEPRKEGDQVFLYSTYGNARERSDVPGGVELKFKIFHGRGGLKFDFTVGLMFDSVPGVMAANAPTGLDFETRAGFSWRKPPPLIDPTQPPDSPPGGGGSSFYRAGLIVKLYRPGEDAPVHVWDLPDEGEGGLRTFTFPETVVDGATVFVNPALMRRYGWWRLEVAHKDQRPAHIYITSTSYLQTAQIRNKTLGYRWLNHAFRNVLDALSPRASIVDDLISAGIGEEMAHAIGAEPLIISTSYEELRGNNSELKSVSAYAMNGVTLKNELRQLLERYALIPGVLLDGVWEQITAPLDDGMLVIKLEAAFLDPSISFSKLVVSGELVFDAPPVIYLAFRDASSQPWCFVDLHYRIRDLNIIEKGLFKLFASDKYELLTNLNKEVTKAIGANSETIGKYFKKALERAAGKNVVIDGFRATAEGWELDFYNFVMPDTNYVAPTVSPHLHATTHPMVHATTGVGSNAGSAGAPILEPVDTGPSHVDPGYGVFPENFYVSGGAALDRLDRIKTIFVIMMENRSFDHFLGYLRDEAPPSNGGAYITFPDDFSNPGAANFVGPLKPEMASVIFDSNVLVTPISPEHEYDHVLKQISDGLGTPSKIGLMQGFTLDFLDRLNETEVRRSESPQMVMAYYGKEELQTYHFLASNFMVLDQWFCAHPGPTWPNRIASLTGHLVELRNLSLTKDERIGYLRDETVFDALNRYNIDWLYMESNASIMRLFDFYRTDDTKVIPLREHDKYTLTENNMKDHYLSALELLLRRTELPRVVFIEPRFSDAPPLLKAYDDLAPASIGNGQGFIRDVCDLLFKSAHWSSSALLITYDEHGGFFDHAPPPGTSYAKPEVVLDPTPDENDNADPRRPNWRLHGAPPLHPDPQAPTFLGVRVPTLLISPLVSGRSVCHALFDHTSILKSILVHNRAKIPRDAFNLFGERVNQAEHIGVALDLDAPRPAPAIPEELPSLFLNPLFATETSGISSYYDSGDPAEKSDFHEALRTVLMPRNGN
jgi:phospholipase C